MKIKSDNSWKKKDSFFRGMSSVTWFRVTWAKQTVTDCMCVASLGLFLPPHQTLELPGEKGTHRLHQSLPIQVWPTHGLCSTHGKHMPVSLKPRTYITHM